MNDWPFADPPETTVLTLRSVLEGKPVLIVEHDEQGYWYFLPNDHGANTQDLALAQLGRVVELHPAVKELSDLPRGWRAERESPESPWEPENARTREASRASARDLCSIL